MQSCTKWSTLLSFPESSKSSSRRKVKGTDNGPHIVKGLSFFNIWSSFRYVSALFLAVGLHRSDPPHFLARKSWNAWGRHPSNSLTGLRPDGYTPPALAHTLTWFLLRCGVCINYSHRSHKWELVLGGYQRQMNTPVKDLRSAQTRGYRTPWTPPNQWSFIYWEEQTK